jgi:BNR/Asp-box repeat.
VISARGGVDTAGSFRSGGLWAIRGATLFRSTDAGASWAHSSIPVPSFVTLGMDFLLDASHVWAITLGPGTTGETGSASDVIRYVVSRSANGGTSWRSTQIAGNYAGTTAAIAFADLQHGYLLAAAQRHSFGTSTVLRSSDGGATWSIAGTSPWLGSLLAVSDASTVWAGGQEQAGGDFAQPILAVSRDAGGPGETLSCRTSRARPRRSAAVTCPWRPCSSIRAPASSRS